MTNRKSLAYALGCLLTVAVTGCSRDIHQFYSTMDSPKTIKVIETSTDNVVWAKEIPVNHRLMVDFDRTWQIEGFTGVKPELSPNRMKWSLYKRGLTFPFRTDGGSVELPGTSVRLDMEVRSTPEFPPTYKMSAPASTTPDQSSDTG